MRRATNIVPLRRGPMRPRRRIGRDSEHAEQAALFRWAEFARVRLPELALLFAIPNGGHRNKVTAARLKVEGVKRGVPDVCLPVARNGAHGLWIELKAGRGRPTPEQIGWIRALRRQGYVAAICQGWEEARSLIEGYLTADPQCGRVLATRNTRTQGGNCEQAS